MDEVTPKRKLLNQQQTTLRQILTSKQPHDQAIQAFLDQHAHLHAHKVVAGEPSAANLWSYEDEILHDLSEDQMRTIPGNHEHSIVWCLWHLARIEDVAMNLLVGGTRQVFWEFEWNKRVNVAYQDTGNEMDARDKVILSHRIDIPALRGYRIAVGKRTRAIVQQLEPHQLKEKVDPVHIQQVKNEGALVEAAYGIADYWSKRDIAGLLLMPATRHNLVHLNEANRIKQQLG